MDRIHISQIEDPDLVKIIYKIKNGETQEFSPVDTGALQFEHRLCVLNVPSLKKEIIEDGKSMTYAVHPGTTKIYQDLKQTYWWDGMKRNVAEFVAHCLICQHVKAEHQRST